MLPEHLQEARDLLILAREDLLAAERLLQGQPLISSALFHSQQAAEKALKAYLTFHQQPYPRTHDLGALIDLSATVDPNFQLVEQIGDKLTPYAVVARYDRVYAGVSVEFVRQVIDDARRIVAFAERRLPDDVTQ